MTTVAWDGETLAADKQGTVDGTPYPITKIAKVKNDTGTFLVGFCGDIGDGQSFIEYVRRGFKNMPAYNDFTGVVITKGGEIQLHGDANVCSFKADQFAVGSGGKFARGAMAFGATAVEAVLIASDLDTMTGLGVDRVSFSKTRKE